MDKSSLDNRLSDLERTFAKVDYTALPPRESNWHHIAADCKPDKMQNFRAFVAYHQRILYPLVIAIGITTSLSLLAFALQASWAGLILFVPLICLVRLFVLWQNAYHVMASSSDLTILENAADVEQCLIEVEYMMGLKRVGVDRGVAWFSNNALCFNGLRSSFVVGSQDLALRQLDRGQTHRIFLKHPKGMYDIRFKPLVFPSSYREESVGLFLDNLRQFRLDGPPTSTERQYPPSHAASLPETL